MCIVICEGFVLLLMLLFRNNCEADSCTERSQTPNRTICWSDSCHCSLCRCRWHCSRSAVRPTSTDACRCEWSHACPPCLLPRADRCRSRSLADRDSSSHKSRVAHKMTINNKRLDQWKKYSRIHLKILDSITIFLWSLFLFLFKKKCIYYLNKKQWILKNKEREKKEEVGSKFKFKKKLF